MIIWLASYPKSGNTWLRSLLATYFFYQGGSFNFEILKKIDQFPSYNNFKDYIAFFSNPTDTAKYWIKEQEKINKDKKIRFFKTHNALCKINGNSFTNNENTLGAIYIIRDPRNVITSLANHYQINLDEAFNFMKNKNKGISQKKGESYVGFVALLSWVLHVKSWTENILYPTLTIRYEDLQNNTFNELKKIIEFINSITNSKKIFNIEKAKNSINLCSFDNLKGLENKIGFDEAVTKKNSEEKIKFFNLGKNNDYKKLLNFDLIQQMNTEFKNELKKYKYD